MNREIANQLKSWDGIHTEFLKACYEQNQENDSFFRDLTEISRKVPEAQNAATWLIKHHYDNGAALPSSLVNSLLASGKAFIHWEARLHLLQLLPYFKLTGRSLIDAEDFVRDCLTDSNKFVRAWAYNGLYELTKYIPGLCEEVEFLCQRAIETESAAIKARVKKILSAIGKKKGAT